MKESTFYTEKYFHQYCTEGLVSEESCGTHTGCHEAYVHTQCVNCNKEAYLKSLGKKEDENRVSKTEAIRIMKVNCGLELDNKIKN